MTTKSGKLTKKERVALEHLSNGPIEAPKGVAGTTIFSMKGRGWIAGPTRAYDFGPELYVTTMAGKERLASE